MKKLFTLCLLAVTMCAVAQEKKVAVYVTGEDNPMNQILGDRLVDGIAQSGKYKAVERTASFLQELSKEQDYQRSGNVDETDISRLGKQFGVDYVCVATILDVWDEKYLTSRLIDVETAEVVASSSSSGQITSSQQFIAAMNTLSNGLLNTLAQAQEGRKKVAVYVTRTGNKDVDIILGDKLVAGFAQSGRFCAIERTNGFLKQLGKEQGYQQSGAVDDEELTRLGKQFGVDYVCIAKTAALFGDYYITSRLIDVETVEVVNSDKAEGVKLNTSAEVVAVASNIAKTLSGMTIKEQAEAKQAERLKAEQEAQRRAEIARQEQLQSGAATGTIAGHEYVDLGLPSGTLWARCNIGASSPEDYGNYYAWGETTTKSNYDWTTYKWCRGSSDRQTKYNTKSSFGTVDNKTVLEMSDDAAHVNWGGDWRMPTTEEWNELNDKCTWTWTTQGGKNGYRVTGPNGKRLFLPAAGYRLGTSLYFAGSNGLYWSSSLGSDGPNDAYGMDFYSDFVNPQYYLNRCIGFSVRPVR